MDFPHVTYDTVTGALFVRAKFHTKPNFKITIGGNVSSTAFNQAYIGVNYKTSAVSGSSWAPTSTSGRSTRGVRSEGARISTMETVFLDYSYNFAVRNFRHGSFGNVTKIDNTRQVKNSESFFRVAAGCRSPTAASPDRAPTADMSTTGTIRTSFSPTIPTIRAIRSSASRPSWHAIRSTSSSIPAGVPNCNCRHLRRGTR